MAETKTPIDPKHKRLADLYLVHLNAARAGREAGYSASRAKSTACIILSRPEVQDYIAEQSKQLEQLNKARAFRIYEELAVCGHSDIRDYVITKNGNVKLAKGVTEDAWRAVASVEVKQIGEKKVTKFRLHPKAEFVRMQGQSIAMFKDVLETRDRTLEDALDELDDADGAS
jgi:phage terminase small subunit